MVLSARAVASKLLPPAAILPALATFGDRFRIQPNVPAGLTARPWMAIFGVLAVVGTVFTTRGKDENRFRASSATLVGLFGCACVGVYPYGLVARVAGRSVLAADAAAENYGLTVGLGWWLPGMLLVVAYSTYAHRRFFKRSV